MNKFQGLLVTIILVIIMNSCGSIFDGTNSNAPRINTTNNIESSSNSKSRRLCKEAENTCLRNFSIEFCTSDLYKCMSYIKD